MIVSKMRGHNVLKSKECLNVDMLGSGQSLSVTKYYKQTGPDENHAVLAVTQSITNVFV